MNLGSYDTKEQAEREGKKRGRELESRELDAHDGKDYTLEEQAEITRTHKRSADFVSRSG